MNIIKQGKKIDLRQTKEFQSDCALNTLKYFHILTNNSVDLMHDCHEGIIPFLLEHFFTYLTKNKCITPAELVKRIRDFNYGSLNKKNKPSPLNIDRKKLGQNAAQLYCLMKHIPFIFNDYKDKLFSTGVWFILTSLLKIMQIITSREIFESEVIKLENIIPRHLEQVMTIFGIDLIPKYHFLIHYPSVIRAMGPPISLI